MAPSALAEPNGATGFMEHGVDFDALTAQKFDPITLNGLPQKQTHLLGSGHDGEIMQPAQEDKKANFSCHLVGTSLCSACCLF